MPVSEKSHFLASGLFGQEREVHGVLWLPHFEKHPIGRNIDFLSGLNISHALAKKPPRWSEALRSFIQGQNLPLEESISSPDQIIFLLPQGFTCQHGLILQNCNWSSPDSVYEQYKKSSSTLFATKIQAPNIWGKPLAYSKDVEWINL